MSKWFRKEYGPGKKVSRCDECGAVQGAPHHPECSEAVVGDLDVVPTGGKTLVLRRKERTMGSLLKLPSGELLKVQEPPETVHRQDLDSPAGTFKELTAENGQKVQVNTHQVVWIEDAE